MVVVSTGANDTVGGGALLASIALCSCSLWFSFSAIGSIGELGPGLARALASSSAALMTRSVVLVVGMVT